MNRLLIIVMFSANAYAAPYIELGIAKADGGTCIRDYKIDTRKWGCSESPLGNATIGYSYKNFSVEAEHWSSLTEKDKGLNLFTFKYRFNLTK